MTARFVREDDDEASTALAPVDGVREVVRLEPAAGGGAAVAEAVLERLARAGRFRDEETAEHVERMSRSCALIARRLGWSPERCSALRAASAMHDIGKVGVPDSILRKPGKLTPEERPLVEAHTTIGRDILAGSDDPTLELAATIALTHHESFDGNGYPDGLRGEAIPLAGRIAAVADVFDALTHDRVYRSAFSIHESLELMREGRGSKFDPAVLDAFERVLPEIEEIRALYPDAAGARPGHGLFVSPARPIRALIMSAHGAVGKGLELLLRREGVDVSGSTGSIEAAERILDQTAVDVMVVDADLDRDRATSLAAKARRRGVCVLLYTSASGPDTEKSARAMGADGVAAREGSPAEFVAAVQAVARGEKHFDPRVAPNTPSNAGTTLTPREREVVILLATGLSGEEIAERLFLSSETVRTHVRNAMQRLRVKTRAHLIARAITTGEIPDAPAA